MLLIPAIDLKDGHCVRLQQGDIHKNVTIFSTDPAETAQYWLTQGARRLHLVDLNGASAGKQKNKTAVRAILTTVHKFASHHGINKIPVQLDGGIRDLNTIENYLDNCLFYIIIGTVAVKNPSFLHKACSAFPNKIIVGLMLKIIKLLLMAGVSYLVIKLLT